MPWKNLPEMKCVMCQMMFKPDRPGRRFCCRMCASLWTGPRRSTYKGGRTISAKGYVLVLAPKHPRVHADRYIFEHRLVMERHLGRQLRRHEIVHHINGIKTDNRVENLQVMTNRRHSKMTCLRQSLNQTVVCCPHCQAKIRMSRPVRIVAVLSGSQA